MRMNIEYYCLLSKNLAGIFFLLSRLTEILEAKLQNVYQNAEVLNN